MEWLYFLIFSVVMFLLPLIGYRKYSGVTLYALAIGGVVNANYYHAMVFEINIFGLPFGIDSVIYTLFIFCVVVWYIIEGLKGAISITISSVAAIIIAAVIQLSGDLISDGSSVAEWQTFGIFMITSVAIVVAIAVMLYVFEKIKGKVNHYVLLIIGIIIASLLNTAIYYPFMILITGHNSNDILPLLNASYLGKSLSLIISLGTLYIMKCIDKKVLKKDGSK